MINSSYLVLPGWTDRPWLRNSFLVIGASFILSLFALVSIPLPFTPIPIATQPQVVLALAVLLGSRRAVAAVLLYLVQGAMGLPVFAGRFWTSHLSRSKRGYLLGYLVAAFITGWVVERLQEKTALNTFSAMALGNAVIFLCGAAWLSHFVGFQGALMLGVVPFLLGDLFKLIVATRGLKAFRFPTV